MQQRQTQQRRGGQQTNDEGYSLSFMKEKKENTNDKRDNNDFFPNLEKELRNDSKKTNSNEKNKGDDDNKNMDDFFSKLEKERYHQPKVLKEYTVISTKSIQSSCYINRSNLCHTTVKLSKCCETKKTWL